ncbi:hypothetical protein D3C84_945080 [compost metagenome]
MYETSVYTRPIGIDPFPLIVLRIAVFGCGAGQYDDRRAVCIMVRIVFGIFVSMDLRH